MAETIDGKKEEYRNYLESSGVIDSITKVLIGLYEESEKPENPLEFIQQHLAASIDGASDIEALKKENEELKARVEENS
ncbi:C-Myc-binding protein [Salpingoeca rosetta]|uniref:c-Myc-binding protein n=1 Tax=Salpingoeca rosetta (strain ATCC 50818 / BSB-021) TaxID=946362 RepID=F2U3Q9_SALR5|nr:C-Myc-binding protein [Salpingoeca rosetta]EGD82253.1 C-Myc-binding protein [Salpingoeca rosetta]|eukprot:XP_004996436.1 C-Myc-binding protein [Salpingoeca rosetta]